MSTPVEIKDGKGTGKSAHLHQKNGDIGLITYTHPLKERTLQFIPAINPNEGVEMARNGAFGGTPDIVHTGITDGVHWTGANVVGAKGNFNSGDQANTGVVSVLVDNPTTNDIWQFDKGSDLTISSYVALTFFVYVDSDWSSTESISVFAWDTGTASVVGNEVFVEDYINEFNFDVWQKATIPFTDLGLSTGTLDALRMQMVGTKTGKNPKIYLDDIQFEESGTPVQYCVEPPKGYKFLISRFNWTIIDALDTALLNNSMPNLSYNKLLNEASLPAGITFSLVQGGVTNFSSSIHNIGDVFKGGGNLVNEVCDGTNTSITLSTEFTEPTVLDSRTNDFIGVTINDDLTTLISLTAVAMGKIEEVSL